MAVCRSRADLPDMLGPVMIIIWVPSLERLTELAMYFSPGGSCRSMTGWRPPVISMSSESSTTGRL